MSKKNTDFRAVDFREGKVVILDQTRLPGEEIYLESGDWRGVAEAIRSMRVRGAPAIGIAAAYGIAMAARTEEDAAEEISAACKELARTRPTAVNLFWAIERMRRLVAETDADKLASVLADEALRIASEQDAADHAIGELGAELLPDRCRVLTHCNAGGLATHSFGTALGVIKAAHRRGKGIFVWVDETRPLLQGARLTAWELRREGVDMALICDNMAGHLMHMGKVDAVITGADRIAANGDVANKIGTYTLAVLASRHGIPFYVAAPISTLDPEMAHGDAIPIEERDPQEITCIGGLRVAPEDTAARNYAFDMTPAELISAIITERGVFRPPFGEALRSLKEGNKS
jgi:methylthioribose-1-phosphate isomerase